MSDYAYRRTQTYNDCVNQYRKNSDVTSQLFDALEELARDPFHASSLHTHRVKRAKGDTYVSDVGGRNGKRLIWRLVGRTIILLLFGEHGPVYRRAERLSLEVDEADNIIRVFDARPADGNPAPYAQWRHVQGTLFMAYTDPELQTFGLFEHEILPLRRLDTGDELVDLEDRMRPEAWGIAMNLCLYGHPQGEQAAAAQREAAERQQQSEPVPEVDLEREDRLAKALRSAKSKAELAPVEGSLAQVLSQPIEDWMVFLHPDQLNLVERAHTGPARVRGAAGTGKTVVGLHRAAFLARCYDDPILFTTYIRTLPRVLDQLFTRLAPDVADRVEFRGVHSWAASYLHSIGRHLTIEPAQVAAAYNAAWTKCAPDGSPLARSGLPKAYFRDEIDWIIRGRGCRQVSDYLKLARSGRGTPLGEAMRNQVWALYDEYRRELKKKKTYDFSSLIEEALREVNERGTPTQYAAVIVDEAQDLTEISIRLLYELAGRDKPDGLLILGDGQQSIYPGGFTLGAIGIGVRGRSTILSTNYRNTAEVLKAALAVVEGRPYDDLDDDLAEGPREITVLRRGAEPSRQVFDDATTHDLALCETLLDASNQKGTDIGDLAVLVPTRRLVQHYLTQIADLGLPTVSLEDYEGLPISAVKVGTYKRSKGLEFKQVFLPRLDLVELSHQDSTDQANSESQDILRRSIFVALTRARDRIWLGGVSAQRQADWWTISEPPAVQQGDGR